MLFHLAEPAALIGLLVAFVIGIYARDTAQVLAARALGTAPDFSPRLVAAPLKERLSPFSAVAFLITGVGWAEPIRMDERWRKRRFRVAAAILAGPLAYLLLSLLSLLAVTATSERLYLRDGDRVIELGRDIGFGGEILIFMAITFAAMFVVSLIPVPPTDGGRMLFLLGPRTPGWHNANMKLTEANWGLGILLALLLLPVLIGFPSIVGQLVPPLLRGLGGLVGATFF